MATKTTRTKTAPATAKKAPLDRAKREELIKYWRAKGWTYDKITAKFEDGVTEAEYEEERKKWEA